MNPEPVTARTVEGDDLMVRTIADLLDPDNTVATAHDVDEKATRLRAVAALDNAGMWQVGADGSGTTLHDLVAALAVVGRHAVDVPLAEAGPLASWLCERAGIRSLPGVATVPVPSPGDFARLVGEAELRIQAHHADIPHLDVATSIVFVAADKKGGEWCVVVDRSAVNTRPDGTGRGELRLDATISGDAVVVEAGPELSGIRVSPLPANTSELLLARGALTRCALMCGAMEFAVDSASSYAKEREQFGRPIFGFQAVAHILAVAAEQNALAFAATTNAADLLEDSKLRSGPLSAVAAVARARVVCHEAAELVSMSCHQVFGAIGFTFEHPLHFRTRRLWQWDQEWGPALHWYRRLETSWDEAAPGEFWDMLRS